MLFIPQVEQLDTLYVVLFSIHDTMWPFLYHDTSYTIIKYSTFMEFFVQIINTMASYA